MLAWRGPWGVEVNDEEGGRKQRGYGRREVGFGENFFNCGHNCRSRETFMGEIGGAEIGQGRFCALNSAESRASLL